MGMRVLMMVFAALLGAALSLPVAWMGLAMPGSHALEANEAALEPGLWLDADEMGTHLDVLAKPHLREQAEKHWP